VHSIGKTVICYVGVGNGFSVLAELSVMGILRMVTVSSQEGWSEFISISSIQQIQKMKGISLQRLSPL
jgi:hypothetical protein